MNTAKMNTAKAKTAKVYNGKRWNTVNTSATNEGANIASRNKAIENRRAFVPEITNSRQDTGENHPKEALLIMGHGNEGFKPRIPIEDTDTPEIIAEKKKDLIPDLIPVPKGSIVVIKSHSGDVTKDIDTMYQYTQTLNKSNEDIILDPIANIDKITKLFGTLAIYREGDLCPNLQHSYVSDWDELGMFILEPSGTVAIPLKNPMDRREVERYISKKIIIPKSMTIKEYKEQRNLEGGFNIADMLKLHTGSNGKNRLLEQTEQKLDEVDQNKTFDEVYKSIYGTWHVKQKDLFKFMPNRITYAFNCRFIDNHETYVPEYVRLGLKSNENIQQMELRQKKPNYRLENKLRRFSATRNLTKRRNSINRVNNRLKTIKRVNNRKPLNIAPEIKEQIRESVLQRRLGAVAFSKKDKEDYENYIFKKRFGFNSSNDNNQKYNSRFQANKEGLKEKWLEELKEELNKNEPEIMKEHLNMFKDYPDLIPKARSYLQAALDNPNIKLDDELKTDITTLLATSP